MSMNSSDRRSILCGSRLLAAFSTVFMAIAADTASVAGSEAPLRIQTHTRTGQALYVSPADRPAPPAALAGEMPDAWDLLHSCAAAFGIADPATDLILERAETDHLGFRHNTFQQMHGGVPVFSGVIKVHQDSEGRFVSANGRFHKIPRQVDTLPRLTREQAIAAASAIMASPTVSVEGALLTIVDPGWYGDPAVGPHLAYYIALADDVSGAMDAFFIDADTGGSLDRWSLICTALHRQIHDAQEGAVLPGVLVRSEGEPPVGDEDLDRLYDYAGDLHGYLWRGFGRDSVDGQGLPIIASGHVGAIGGGCPNASWSFIHGRAAFCTGTTSDDIVAHELAHGLTQATANLIYQNQPGQLNESFSDVFGELVDLFNGNAAFAGPPQATPAWPTPSGYVGPGLDTANNARGAGCTLPWTFPDGVRWLIGEDAVAFSGSLRDMWNPPCYSDPDFANSSFQTCDPLDQGGVHTGSGIPNHAFAMLCDGKTFNGRTLVGIGPIKAGAVWFRALTVYLTVASDFEDAYLAFNQAAADLVGTYPLDPRTGLPSADMFTTADAEQVVQALQAVEMNTPGACGKWTPVLNSTAPPQCAQQFVVFADDFESGADGWAVENSGPPTPYDWVLVTNLPFDRPGTAFLGADPMLGDCQSIDESAVHALISPVVTLPTDLVVPTLAFTHYVETEPRYDGGHVLLRVNGGPWQPIPPVAMYYNTVNTSLFAASQGSTSPLAGQVAFTGVGGQWGTTLVDLGPLAGPGDSIQIRFELGKDGCFGYRGWYVDDVVVYGCLSSGDCNGSGVPDEVERLQGPTPELLWRQVGNSSSGNLSDADLHPTIGVNLVAEDFRLLRGKILHTLKFRGGYTDNTPVPDDFTAEFRLDDGGLPGAVAAVRSSAPTVRVATGRQFLHVDEFDYTLSLDPPVILPAGAYFAVLYNDTTGHPTTWVWQRAFFGWQPGLTYHGQGCAGWCRSELTNMSLEILGAIVGRQRADLNADGWINGLDIAAFAATLVGEPVEPDARCGADVNADGTVDEDDLPGFVECLLHGACP